jgi:hypothetical protein
MTGPLAGADADTGTATDTGAGTGTECFGYVSATRTLSATHAANNVALNNQIHSAPTATATAAAQIVVLWCLTLTLSSQQHKSIGRSLESPTVHGQDEHRHHHCAAWLLLLLLLLLPV